MTTRRCRPIRIIGSGAYGKLSFDQTHKLVTNFLWELPRMSKVVANSVVKAIFDEWQFNGIATFSSGTPSGIAFTTTDNADITGGGDGARVVMLQNPILDRENERTSTAGLTPTLSADRHEDCSATLPRRVSTSRNQ